MSLSALLLAGAAVIAAPTWLTEQALRHYLGDANEVSLPLSEIVSSKSINEICVMVGAYAREVPAHIPAIEPQLVEAGLLPVAEGSGLVFAVSDDRLVEATVFDVWGASPVLELPDDPTCYRVDGGTLRIWRFGSDGIRLTFSHAEG